VTLCCCDHLSTENRSELEELSTLKTIQFLSESLFNMNLNKKKREKVKQATPC